ncbi:NAD-dependent epimerase/dehydratase family protein [Sphaerisporangium sp. TRM90804]|uniref:NAD-dependent epimerase/dehydratase family protein n=1 Tax=Sphaerisporangium sp. TRM90804 TaxID=3031113 RepID=UPI002447E426|nr:NAD-dependent epimerase/dehydratase family protein [Sphaerisporangium sp. TRM90804]MDH2425438.1 NAD-dependent epimerase/dehydratase family protein [Sphaerisporangium sp. TRM90804]
MKVLILGGSEFVGRAFVEEALSLGWPVTVFNRGTHPPPPGVTALRGDRSAPGGLAALEHGEWDIVVDTWSWAPSAVRDTARLLAGRAGHYVYVSSRSVYAYPAPAGATEDAPVVESTPDRADADDYAATKRGGELAALGAFGDRALLARAGLVLGPYENIGRLPWWLLRVARGGPVLAPGPADAERPLVDARDLAAWSLAAAARGLAGPYDVVSPPGHATMRTLLEACVKVTGSDAELWWAGPEPILAAGVQPWTDLPIWLPPGELDDHIYSGDVSKAVAAGLRCRPAEQTVADTWAWLRRIGGEPPMRPDRPSVGLDPAVEAALLEGLRPHGGGRPVRP